MSENLDYKKWFEEASLIKDEIERSQAYDDLAYDAEGYYEKGEIEKARFLFEQLMSLGDDNDLYQVAYDTAKEYLEKINGQGSSVLEDVVEKLEKEYVDLPAGYKEVAIAKILYRDYSENKKFLKVALEFFEKSQQHIALSKKDEREMMLCKMALDKK